MEKKPLKIFRFFTETLYFIEKKSTIVAKYLLKGNR